MPLMKKELSGTEQDGSKSDLYCIYCYREGNFVDPTLTEEKMIQKVVAISVEKKIFSKEQAETFAKKVIPTLSRWKAKS